MHIHILGICGTFMGGVALLAQRAGYRVTGSDQNTYPPMSTLLESEGIELTEEKNLGVLRDYFGMACWVDPWGCTPLPRSSKALVDLL